jgi:hypothetical protein
MRSIKSGAVLLLIMAPLIIALGSSGSGAEKGGYKEGIIHGDTSAPDDELLKQYGDKVPDRPIINEFTKKLGGSFFPHKEHVDAKRARCGNCHHKNPREIKFCWECHHEKEPEDPKAPKYLKAYHDLCLGCHKAIKKEKALGPVDPPPTKKCYDCHFKKGAPGSKQAEKKEAEGSSP